MDATPRVPSTAEKMKFVKAACDNAPAAPRKDAAMRHYLLVEKAKAAQHDGECNRQLDSAARDLVCPSGADPA